MISVAIGEKESEGIRKKPAPDTVREALKELGSTAESTVYVGDSDVDIETARNSGMDEILCDWGFRGEEFLKEHQIRYDHIIYNAPYGERILINDQKPSGLNMAISLSPARNQCCTEHFVEDPSL